jgi:hypothetical protein
MNHLTGLIILVFAISIFGLLFAFYLSRWVLRSPMGSEPMRKISDAIKGGAEADGCAGAVGGPGSDRCRPVIQDIQIGRR